MIWTIFIGCATNNTTAFPDDDGVATQTTTVTDTSKHNNPGQTQTPSGLSESPDPGMPVFPDVIDTLTISARTGQGEEDGTDDNTLSVCLSDTDCFTMNLAEIDDFRVGQTDVYMFNGINIPRSDVDRVEIRSTSGADRWVPSCIEMTFDGEPVYCEDSLGMWFGEGVDEIESWTDPKGLHRNCETCFDSPLTHGPLMGGTEPDTLRLWTRTHATTPVAMRLSDTDDINDGVIVDWLYAFPSEDFTGTLEVSELTPNTQYLYRIEIDGVVVSDTHSVKTAPAIDVPEPFSFSFGSCAKDEEQPIFGVIESMAPDLFFFVGDNHYGNTDQIDALRWFYRFSRSRPQRASLLSHTPTLAVWDDHDFTGNNTDGTELGKIFALQGFEEYWANPSYGTQDILGVFSVYEYGDVDFFLLDDRFYRGFADSVLGAQQTEWLMTALSESDATFRFLISGSQWTAEGSTDSWAAFPQARSDLFAHLAELNMGGVVLLSGDIHRSEFRLLPREGAYDLPELTSSPLATWTNACPTSDELIGCYGDGISFVRVDVDTTLTDPELIATLFDVNGVERVSWTIKRSQLQ